MQTGKEFLLREIEARARRRTAQLASQLLRAASSDKEEILAAFRFERWLADNCCEALDDYGRRRERQL